jgi:hypothetical protein
MGIRWIPPIRCLLLLCSVSLLGSSTQGVATTVDRLSFIDLSREAQLIVQGTVSNRRLEVRDGIPWTCIKVDIERLIRGSAGSAIELCFLGGKIGTTTTAVAGTEIPEVGKRGIFFTHDPSARFVNPIVGWSQGIYYVAAEGGREFVTTASGARISEISLSDTLPAVSAYDAAAGVVTAQPGATGGITTEDFIRAIHQALVKQP